MNGITGDPVANC